MSIFNFYLNNALKLALTTSKRASLYNSPVNYLESFALSHNFTSRPNQKFFDEAYLSIEKSGFGKAKVFNIKRLLKLLDLTAGTCCTNSCHDKFISPIPLPSVDDASKVVARFCFPITAKCPLPHLIQATINSLEQQSSLSDNSIGCLKSAILDLYVYATHDRRCTYSLDLIEFWNSKSLSDFELGKITKRIKDFQNRASVIITSFANTGSYSCDYRFGIVPEPIKHTAFYTAVQEALNQLKSVYEPSVFEQIKVISNKLLRFASVNKFNVLTKEAINLFIKEEMSQYSKNSSYYGRSLCILRQLDRMFSLNVRNPYTGLLLNEIAIDDEKASSVEGLSLEMKEKCTIDAVIAQAKVVIQKIGLSASTVRQYVRAWRMLIGFVVSKYGNIYCQTSIDEFLESVEEDYSQGKLNEWMKKLYRRAALVLKEVAKNGAFTWRAFQFVRPQLTDEQEEIKKHLQQDLRMKNLSEARIEFYGYVLRSFFLCTGIETKQQLANMKESTVIKVSKHFREHCCKSSLSNIVPTLRACLEWFFDNGYIAFDFSRLVLSINYVDCHVVPYLSEDDELKLRKFLPELNVRDRAMLLLAMDLGIRNSDIVNLRLSNIDWKQDRINIIQHKTGVPASYPLLEEVGNALFDYITQMRPDDAESDYVFVRFQAPHTHFRSTYDIISNIFNSLGISPQNGHGKGAHTLRYTLTHRLLSKGEIPHQTITGVLGHKTNSSDKSYRSMEDEKLMECALDFDEIGSYDLEG